MDKNKIRPLSPHLTIHKKIPSAIFSITHRITGFGLYLGTIIIVIFPFNLFRDSEILFSV